MKFFVALAALVAVAVASPVKRPVPSPIDAPVVPSPLRPTVISQPAALVQLIVNVNGVPLPITIDDVIPDAPVIIDPVQVVDIDPIVIDPVQVIDIIPVVVEPIQIDTPVIPSPAVNLPDELN